MKRRRAGKNYNQIYENKFESLNKIGKFLGKKTHNLPKLTPREIVKLQTM